MNDVIGEHPVWVTLRESADGRWRVGYLVQPWSYGGSRAKTESLTYDGIEVGTIEEVEARWGTERAAVAALSAGAVATCLCGVTLGIHSGWSRKGRLYATTCSACGLEVTQLVGAIDVAARLFAEALTGAAE